MQWHLALKGITKQDHSEGTHRKTDPLALCQLLFEDEASAEGCTHQSAAIHHGVEHGAIHGACQVEIHLIIQRYAKAKYNHNKQRPPGEINPCLRLRLLTQSKHAQRQKRNHGRDRIGALFP